MMIVIYGLANMVPWGLPGGMKLLIFYTTKIFQVRSYTYRENSTYKPISSFKMI